MQHRPTALVVCALVVAGCGDYSAPSEVINGVATATLQAPGANFTQYRTFTVTDKIQVVDDTGNTTEEYTLDAAQIAAKVQSRMTERGYVYVPFAPGAVADLVVGLYAFKGTAAYGGYYCDYWYWGYYPYDCGYYYAGSYKFGTLVMRMADFKNAPPGTPGATLPIVWGSASYGVLSTQPYNVQRVLDSIDTAFDQSPYLHP